MLLFHTNHCAHYCTRMSRDTLIPGGFGKNLNNSATITATIFAGNHANTTAAAPVTPCK